MQHMDLETFKILLPFFKRTLLVYLQGWGEPLLNPYFFEMAKLVKKAGSQVGTTTNGIALDEKRIGRLIESEIDIIAFSLAGVGEKNDKIREGTNFDQIMKNIDLINREKQKRNSNKPEINIAFLLLKSGLDKIKNLPKTFAGKKINQIIISTLDFVPIPELEEEVIKPNSTEEFLQIQNKLEHVVEIGKKQHLKIFYNIFDSQERRLVCTENIQKALYISSDGAVSPCVFTNLPVNHNIFQNNLIFGNISQTSLSSIWRQKNYKKFRDSFYTKNLSQSCQNCPKLYLT